MEELQIGKIYMIHSYKHDGSFHRSWDEAILMEIHDDYLVFANGKTTVTESDGRTWTTKEPSAMYFFKDRWFNIIGKKKPDGIFYKCNMASPYIIEDDTIKYVDYDLDLKVFTDGAYKVVDKNEYKYHKQKMNYPQDIDTILNSELKSLIEMAKAGQLAFDRDQIKDFFNKYEEIKKIC